MMGYGELEDESETRRLKCFVLRRQDMVISCQMNL